MIIGYLRVSTKEQNVAAQRQVIQDKYQIERWYEDQAASG
ncbi:recombinase family protein, partial [Neisseria gonorrhoeae]